MMLIAESGSTKTDWVLIDGSGRRAFRTPGLNPALLSREELAGKLREALSGVTLPPDCPVYFYGAGCLPHTSPDVEEVLRSITGSSVCRVHSDMLAAARAVCGSSGGVVVILGTGSNSCLYDGSAIVDGVPPLGYILGDEGSGARIGAAFVNALYKRRLPGVLARMFEDETGLDRTEVIRRVYRCDDPNRFLASLTRFISAHIDAFPQLDELVCDEFCRFVDYNLLHAYPRELPVHFVGSLAQVFDKQLRNAIESRGLLMGRTLAQPMEQLVKYHQSMQQ